MIKNYPEFVRKVDSNTVNPHIRGSTLTTPEGNATP